MDFRKLSHVDFEEFVNMDFSEYGVSSPIHRMMIVRAKKKYQQLQSIEGCILPLPIQDLEIAHHYKKTIGRIYTSEEIRSLSPGDAEFFIEEFGLHPIPLEINRQRIFRILTYLGLIEDSQHLLLTPTILEEFSSTLSVVELAEFQLVMNVQQLLIRVPIADPDKQIMSIYPFNASLAPAIILINRVGSIKTFLGCVKNNRIGNLQLFLDWGYDVDNQDGGQRTIHHSSKQTALMVAAMNNRLEIARILLRSNEKKGRKGAVERRGANPNLFDHHGCPALGYAAGEGHLEMVQLLLSHGADPHLKADPPRSLLLDALRGHNLEILELFLKLGVDPNDQVELPQTILIHACAEADAGAVQLLFKYGANPNFHDPGNRPPLVIASRGGCIRFIDRLVRDLPEWAYHDRTRVPLRHIKKLAAKNGWTDIIEILAENKTQSQMQVEWPLIMKKYEPLYLEVVRTLLENGADPNIQDNNGLNPLASAISSGYEKIANLLRSYGAH